MSFSNLLGQIEAGYDAIDEDTQAVNEARDQERWEEEQDRLRQVMKGRSSRRTTKGLESTEKAIAPLMIRNIHNQIDLRKIPYRQFLQTDYWKETRKAVLQQRGYRCEVCRKVHLEGSKRAVDIHHLTYAHRGYEFWNPGDLAVLCKKCHQEHHEGLIDANAIIAARRKA